MTVVSIIENGAGSVDVSARPALPITRSTSGNDFSTRSCVWSSSSACATEIPGRVVGMYRIEPSFSAGMNSEPSCRYAGIVASTAATASAMTVFGNRSTSRHAGS